MMNEEIFKRNVAILSKQSAEEVRVVPCNDALLPSVEALRTCIELVKMIVFPGFFDRRQADEEIRSYHIGVNMERLYKILKEQIALGMLFDSTDCNEAATVNGRKMALQLIDCLPEIKRLLYTDVEAIYQNDPSVRNYSEVIFCYPVVEAMVHYRVAHQLIKMKIPVIPRIITEIAHSKTGIDIHPGAHIGEYFSIAHGTGVVIGETCIIGNHVTLFQGVTLGARGMRANGRSFKNNSKHPVIEDHVTIYSNSTVLGDITIGHNAVIGGNVWVSNNVAPFAHILQRKAVESTFVDGLGI